MITFRPSMVLLCSIITFVCLYKSEHAAIGCMVQTETGSGQKVRHRFDYKNWHYVQCNCLCQKKYRILANGQCWNCLHTATWRMSNNTVDINTAFTRTY